VKVVDEIYETKMVALTKLKTIVWAIPIVIVIILGVITWKSTMHWILINLEIGIKITSMSGRFDERKWLFIYAGPLVLLL